MAPDMRNQRQIGTAVALVVSGLMALGGPREALAQPGGAVTEAEKDAARRHYRAAESKLNSGDYAGALTLYQQAEAIVPIPATKYKIALCNDRLGRVGSAVRWYRAFLDASPPEKMADAIASAQTRLSALERAATQVRVAVTPPDARGLAFSVDGGAPQQGTPVLSLPAGHHRIVVQAEGYNPAAAEFDSSSLSTADVRITLIPALARAPVTPDQGVPDAPEPQRRSDVPAYVMFGLAGAGAVVGTVFGVMAIQDKSAFDKNPTTPGADRTHRDGVVSDIALASALAFAVTGTVLLVTNLGRRAPDTAVRGFVLPYAGPTGGGAIGGLTF